MTTTTPPAKSKDQRTEGCWLAYIDDWTEMAVFSSEIQALRYAVSHDLKVKRIPYGVNLADAVSTTTTSTSAPTERNRS